ncbi:hypothetical protein V8F06_012929 [Rhypophila decipiens]
MAASDTDGAVEGRDCQTCRGAVEIEISFTQFLSTPNNLSCAVCAATRDAIAVNEPAIRLEVEKSGLGRVEQGLEKVLLGHYGHHRCSLVYRLQDETGVRFCQKIPLDVFVLAESPEHPVTSELKRSTAIPESLELPHAIELPTRVLDLGSPGAGNVVKLKVPGGERA